MGVNNNLTTGTANFAEVNIPANNPQKTKPEIKIVTAKGAYYNDSIRFTAYKPEVIPGFSEQKIVNVLRGSAQKGSAEISRTIVNLTRGIPVSANGNDNIHADLKVSATDKNGFLDYGEKDLNVTISGNIKVNKDVFFNTLKSLENLSLKKAWYADISIGKVNFDAKNKSYVFQVKVDSLGPVNDTISFNIKTDKNKNLLMSVDDKWLPVTDKFIFKQVQSAVREKLKDKQFGLETKIVDNNLYFMPQLKNQNVKLTDKDTLRIEKSNLNFSNTNFNIDSKGDIEIDLNDINVSGSNIGKDPHGNNIPEKSSGDIDSASIEVSADINTKGTKEIVIKNGSISTRLDDQESTVVEIEGSNLGRHFNDIGLKLENLNGKFALDKENKVTSNLAAKVAVSLTRPNKTLGLAGNIASNFNSAGDFKITSKDLTVSHPNGISNITDFLVSHDKKAGIKLNIVAEEKPFAPVTAKQSQNDLKIMINSQDYVDKLFSRVDKAKNSINIESYLYSGKIGTDLADKLLAKAGGITQNGSYNVKIDNSSGVKVKVMFDSSTGDQTEQTHESVKLFKDRFNLFINDVKNGNGKYAALSKEERVKVVENVNANMKWKMLEGGVTKIDHRKEIIIDAQSAFSGGGINLTDSAMRKHDMMVEVWGPAVKQIQKEFIENWEEIAGKIPDTEKAALLKSDSDLTKIMKKHQLETGSKGSSKTTVLVTDDNQFDVYQKMSELIKTSKNINIEHAYFTDKKLVEQIGDALKKGTNINVILPEKSDEGDKLHYGNLGTLQQLKKYSEQPGAGKLNAYLYKWNDHDKTGQFTHTKAMSFDGKTAIVGSTNLTARSLHGTVTGFLFNKEMSLMVEDQKFVTELNKKLFNKDMLPEFSKKLDDQWFKDLEKEQAKINKYTEIQPLF
jgi:phosphatidylserine/phosphatidylglycerophosphate/cardiolipin synthase-like enzyme